MRKYLVLLCALVAICLATIAPALAADKPQKGDFILGAGWAYSAPKASTGERLGDWTASLEYMLTDKLSIRSDYYRLNEEAEGEATATSVPVVVDPPGVSLTLAPHIGSNRNLSFPIGMIGLDTHDRKNVEFGAIGGVWVDFWTNNHLGLGLGGSYLYLQNTTIGQDSYDVRAMFRGKF